ncbi:hypothetical protein ACP70R_023380 [Stipagrostis hirtigluma subsp. patula]
MEPPSARSRPDQRDGGLPLDALYEILLRLPAKELCRLRAVCRPWRSLLSDPQFIAAHAAHHPGPLIVLGYHTVRYHPDHRNEGIICDIMDLSGCVVKRVRAAVGNEWVMSIQADHVCTARMISTGLAEEHVEHEFGSQTSIAFGQVASTGEYKVLRLHDTESNQHSMQLCEVFSLDGSSNARWRGKKRPPQIVMLDRWKSVVIDGIVYILSYLPDCVATFDLETEEWRQNLRGPLSSLWNDDSEVWLNNMNWFQFSMAALSGNLVVVHHTHASSLDLWFLMDFEKALWVRQHSIQISVQPAKYKVSPLLVLEDERIILMYRGGKGLIRIYDPKTNTLTDMAETGHFVAVGLYTGSLLSLATSAS